MKRQSILVLTVLCLFPLWNGFSKRVAMTARKFDPAARKTLEVHEWGTVLHVQDQKRGILDGLHFGKEWGVPDFVYRLHKNPPLRPARPIRMPGVMIKPILYFYATDLVAVHAKIGARNGRWLEWWPKAELTTGLRQGQDVLEDPNAGKELTFTGEVVPKGHADHEAFESKLRAIDKMKGWYPLTREPDSSIFRAKFNSQWTDDYEKFLFYRGETTATAPVRAEITEKILKVISVGTEKIRPLFYVDGEHIQNLSEESDNSKIAIAEKGLTVDEAVKALAQITKGLGLNDKEADSMARIWKREYFESPGARLIYEIPRKLIDKEMPLTITPKPKKLVRVQLGMLEMLSEEEVRKIKAEVKRFRVDSTRADAAKKLRAMGFRAHPFLMALRDETVSDILRKEIEKFFQAEEN